MKKKSLVRYLLAGAVIVLIVGLATAWPRGESIGSFEQCAAAGYPIMESYPPQCRTPDGRNFVGPGSVTPEPMPPISACTDHCGDNVCAEIVCLAIGCPCAETPSSCPQDCSR